MNFLDWFLILLVLAYAVSGYWQGFIAGAFATAGLRLGGLFGIWVAPHLLGDVDPALWVSLAALFVVLVCASFGQAVLQYAGTRLREPTPTKSSSRGAETSSSHSATARIERSMLSVMGEFLSHVCKSP